MRHDPLEELKEEKRNTLQIAVELRNRETWSCGCDYDSGALEDIGQRTGEEGNEHWRRSLIYLKDNGIRGRDSRFVSLYLLFMRLDSDNEECE